MEKLNDDKLSDLAVDLVIAMMGSASTSKIRPVDWWQRAKTALVVGASIAEAWPQMIARMGSKLQIDATTYATSEALQRIGETLRGADAFERFRFLCERDALYIVAMAQAKRAEQREQKEGICSMEDHYAQEEDIDRVSH